MDVAVPHDGGRAASVAEERIAAAGDRLVPAADAEAILLIVPSARAAAQALARTGHGRASCLVDLCELQLDAVAGSVPLLDATWKEEPRKLTVFGPEPAYRRVRRVLDAIAPSEHAPDSAGFRGVRAADAPLYTRWLAEPITLEAAERRALVSLSREKLATRWHEDMTSVAERLPFPHAAWAEAAIDAAMREKRAPFGYLFLEWEMLKRKMLDGDEVWTFDSERVTWERLMGRAGIALVRAGAVVDWIVEMMS